MTDASEDEARLRAALEHVAAELTRGGARRESREDTLDRTCVPRPGSSRARSTPE